MTAELNIFIGSIGIIIIAYLLFLIYTLKNNYSNQGLMYGSTIQKNTHTFFFNTKGYLESYSCTEQEKNLTCPLNPGDHISQWHKFKNIDRYFYTCIKHKKNLNIKVIEEIEDNIGTRIDLIFNPLIMKEEVSGVAVIFQQNIVVDREEQHINKKNELEDQRNLALKQVNEIEAEKSEIELAFKKSSKHHIMMQKAMRKIETQKNELEDALVIINNQKTELEQANTEIKKNSKMKEIFLANTSHEIRTPLNAILGFTNLLLSGEITSGQKRYLENIKASGNNLLVVINDILDFSKIESGKLSLEEVDFNFENLMKHTINTLLVKSEDKHINIDVKISPEIPTMVIGDPVRINQILINLLGNAIKFTNPNGHVKLRATLGESENAQLKIIFKIEDDGIGIPKDKLNDIFKSFTQGESDTTRKFGGTGLGLSIVKQLIELQNGKISVESELKTGTKFTFYIMLKRSTSEVMEKIEKEEKLIRDLKNSNHLKLLLVEDNLINQQLTFDTLKAWNNEIEIDLAENGAIAVEKVKRNNYHVVLMDIQMPIMDGNQATKTIRKLPEPKGKTPIIAMTAHALKNEKLNCLSMGMNDYVSKPFDPELLFSKILKYAPQKPKANNSKAQTSTSSKPNYKHFNLNVLQDIYKGNTEKMNKIISMCVESIPKELTEIETSISQKDWDGIKRKAHALKPKLGYLGMKQQQQDAQEIEILSGNKSSMDTIILLLEGIKKHWFMAEVELGTYLSNA